MESGLRSAIQKEVLIFYSRGYLKSLMVELPFVPCFYYKD